MQTFTLMCGSYVASTKNLIIDDLESVAQELLIGDIFVNSGPQMAELRVTFCFFPSCRTPQLFSF